MHMRWIGVMLAAALLGAGCQTSATDDHDTASVEKPAQSHPASAADAEPLTLDGAEAADLLGSDAGNTNPGTQTASADNSRCLVCHGNFQDEELCVWHAKHNIGCEKCHGPSDAHCDDENNITPPQIMYPRDEIDDACHVCHDKDKVSSSDLFCLHILTPKEKGKVCTDCHGNHRMAVRTVRWDKKTRKLIEGGWMEESEKKK